MTTKITLNFILLILCIYATTTANALTWDRKCLEDCFDTHHECKFCAAECEVEYSPPDYGIRTDTPCLLDRYYNYPTN